MQFLYRHDVARLETAAGAIRAVQGMAKSALDHPLQTGGIIVLTIMILPTIVSLSETSLRAVPKSYREASYGLGASEIQTIFKVTIPAAKSGILSAAVLGIGRAIGETMAVMMIAGNPTSGLPKSIWSMVRPLTTNIAMEMSYASGRQSEMLFATGVILFIFIMIVNTTLIVLTHKAGESKK